MTTSAYTTKYHYYTADIRTFDEWYSKQNPEFIAHCQFCTGWRWNNHKYYSTFVVHVHEIMHDYTTKNNKGFFAEMEILRETGYCSSELFHELNETLSSHNFQTSSAMCIRDGFFVYAKYSNIETINAICKICLENFGLHYAVKKNGRSDYEIYLHTDADKIKALNFPEIKPTKRPNRAKPVKKTDLLQRKKELEAELKKINKALT